VIVSQAIQKHVVRIGVSMDKVMDQVIELMHRNQTCQEGKSNRAYREVKKEKKEHFHQHGGYKRDIKFVRVLGMSVVYAMYCVHYFSHVLILAPVVKYETVDDVLHE